MAGLITCSCGSQIFLKREEFQISDFWLQEYHNSTGFEREPTKVFSFLKIQCAKCGKILEK